MSAWWNRPNFWCQRKIICARLKIDHLARLDSNFHSLCETFNGFLNLKPTTLSKGQRCIVCFVLSYHWNPFPWNWPYFWSLSTTESHFLFAQFSISEKRSMIWPFPPPSRYPDILYDYVIHNVMKLGNLQWTFLLNLLRCTINLIMGT